MIKTNIAISITIIAISITIIAISIDINLTIIVSVM